jgi:hypothetical protein
VKLPADPPPASLRFDQQELHARVASRAGISGDPNDALLQDSDESVPDNRSEVSAVDRPVAAERPAPKLEDRVHVGRGLVAADLNTRHLSTIGVTVPSRQMSLFDAALQSSSREKEAGSGLEVVRRRRA